LPANNGNENLANAVTEVSERVTTLIREEIELAKVETVEKAMSLAKGAAAVAVGAVFGLFALIVALSTLAWGLDAILTNAAGDIWIGFAITLGLLLALTAVAFLFAWRKLKVGAPTPKMAIDEAKKIRETVTSKPEA
jgi:ABC-type multidrug transport system fused ATPase/permease subunit